MRPVPLRRLLADARLPSAASAGAVAVTVILGVVPLAAARGSPVASPILARAVHRSSAPVNGPGIAVNFPAPPFRLTDQHGRTVTLARLRGKVVLLTFLDDTRTAGSPPLAQDLRVASRLLGAAGRHVELVAINDKPRYTRVSCLWASGRREGLAGMGNWLYLTGSHVRIQRAWRRYRAALATILPPEPATGHLGYVFILDQHGHLRRDRPGFRCAPNVRCDCAGAGFLAPGRELRGPPGRLVRYAA